MTSKSDHTVATLLPWDPDHDYEVDILKQQRVLCGWGSEDVPLWRERIHRRLRFMLWICLPHTDHEDIPGLGVISRTSNGTNQSFNTVGHIAIDREDFKAHAGMNAEAELALLDGSKVLLSSLFVLPQYAKRGLGRFAMRRCEEMAQEEPYGTPACYATTVNTLHPKHCLGGEEGPDGMGMFGRIGLPVPKASNLAWFIQQGYHQFKEGPRYVERALDGGTVQFWCVFLIKELVPR